MTPQPATKYDKIMCPGKWATWQFGKCFKCLEITRVDDIWAYFDADDGKETPDGIYVDRMKFGGCFYLGPLEEPKPQQPPIQWANIDGDHYWGWVDLDGDFAYRGDDKYPKFFAEGTFELIDAPKCDECRKAEQDRDDAQGELQASKDECERLRRENSRLRQPTEDLNAIRDVLKSNWQKAESRAAQVTKERDELKSKLDSLSATLEKQLCDEQQLSHDFYVLLKDRDGLKRKVAELESNNGYEVACGWRDKYDAAVKELQAAQSRCTAAVCERDAAIDDLREIHGILNDMSGEDWREHPGLMEAWNIACKHEQPKGFDQQGMYRETNNETAASVESREGVVLPPLESVEHDRESREKADAVPEETPAVETPGISGVGSGDNVQSSEVTIAPTLYRVRVDGRDLWVTESTWDDPENELYFFTSDGRSFLQDRCTILETRHDVAGLMAKYHADVDFHIEDDYESYWLHWTYEQLCHQVNLETDDFAKALALAAEHLHGLEQHGQP